MSSNSKLVALREIVKAVQHEPAMAATLRKIIIEIENASKILKQVGANSTYQCADRLDCLLEGRDYFA